MKKILIVIFSIFLLLLIAAISIPFLFKDQLKAKLDQEIEKNISAKAYYGDLDVSIFKNFPKVTLTLNKFGIVGIAPFVGDTLVSATAFHTSFDLMSIVGATFKKDTAKNTIQINKIAFDEPRILLKVLKDGNNNYEIYKKSEKTGTKSSSTFSVNITAWQINDGFVKYDNRQLPALVTLTHVNHEGSGAITESVFDVNSTTAISNTDISYKGKSYLKNRTINFEGPINVDFLKSKYSLKDGILKINDFELALVGQIEKPDTNINLNITFKTKENEDFKKLISILPVFYTNDYKNIESEGIFTVSGNAKGIYNNRQTPQFEIFAKVKDGKVKFPTLSTPISNVAIDGVIQNKTDNLNNTSINFKTFQLNLGKNPIKGRLLLTGLQNADVDADIKGKIDLAEITKIFPLKGMAMRGNLVADVVAKGHYSKENFPKITGKLNLTNGYVKSAEFPEPIENMVVMASILNTSGNAADTKIDITNANITMQGEPFFIKGQIENLNNAKWDLIAKGKLDLTRLTAIFPVEGTTLKGKVITDLTTKGQMSAIKNKQYEQLNASGTATLQDFEYRSVDFPQPLLAKQADLTFTPKQIFVKNATGFLGKSDFTGTGDFSNYFGYVFNNEPIIGNLTINSKNFNMNEWLDDDPNVKNNSLETSKLQAVEIPKDLKLTIKAVISNSAYEKMKINNASGNILIENGTVKMQNVNFNSLGGNFTTNGTYNSIDITHPKFDFDLDLQKLEIDQAYQHLWVVRNLVPIAEYLLGSFSSKFRLNGELGQDMVPKLMSLSGQGLIKMIKAAVKENPLIKEMADKTKLPILKNMVLQDILMQSEIKDGRMGFKPFNFAIKDHKFNVGGFNMVDGSIDWNINVDAPTGNVGVGFNDLFKMWTGKTLKGTERVQFEMQMGGTFKKPKVVFKGSSTADTIKETVTAEVKAQIEAAKAKAQAEIELLKAEAEAKKKELESKVRAEADRLIAEAEAKKKELEDKAKAEVERLKKEALDKIKAEEDRIRKIAEDKIAEEKAKLEKLAQEKRKELEALARAKLDSASRANAAKIQKAMEDKAKKAIEDKKRATEEKANQEIEAKKKAAEAATKAAEDKIKQEIEAKKKAAEDEIKKVVPKDTTGN
jgi:AsmA-like C-terminal region